MGQSADVRGGVSRPTSSLQRCLAHRPVVQGAEALLGSVLVGHDAGARRVRVSVGARSPALCGLRPGGPGIVSQPFVLTAVVGGQRRKHVPDYLLTSDDGPVVVDVEPQERLGHPKVASTLAWAKRVVESRGWRFEVAHEPPEQRASNIRLLAGYRRDWLMVPALLDELREADLNGLTLAEAFAARPGWAAPLVRAALLHLLWRQVYRVDLETLLTPQHVIEASS
jgi:hypothetical protein